MSKNRLILIAGIGTAVAILLLTQINYQPQYLDIQLLDIKHEYKIGDTLSADILLDGYWKLCGSLKLELQNEDVKTFHLRDYQCASNAQPVQLHETIPLELQINDIAPGTYVIKIIFNNKSVQQTIFITN